MMKENHDGMEQYPPKLPVTLKIILILSTVEGLLALVFFFRQSSMERNAQLAGYSTSRLLSGGLVLLLVILLAWMAVQSIRQPTWLADICQKIRRRLVEKKLLIPLASVFAGAIIAISVLFLLFSVTPASMEDFLFYLPAYSTAPDIQKQLAEVSCNGPQKLDTDQREK